jgi:hypothetical protein
MHTIGSLIEKESQIKYAVYVNGNVRLAHG